jgi:SPP1 gp7 family putative phage head morphogenesis protein
VIDRKLTNKIEAQRSAVIKQTTVTAGELATAYQGVFNSIQNRVGTLLGAYETALAAGEDVGANWLYQRNRLAELETQVLREAAKFASAAGTTIDATFAKMIALGAEHEQSKAITAAEGVGARVQFDVLPSAAIRELVGIMKVQRPLLADIPATLYQRLSQMLINGVALGRNPKVVARQTTELLGVPLTRALTIARTEQLRAYREAQHQSRLKNSDAFSGWIWYADLSTRTCAICWSLHGKTFPTEQRLNDHPNGRCTSVPQIAGFEDELPDGEAEFAKLSKADQLKILGPKKFEQYKDGFKLRDFVADDIDPNWGKRYKLVAAKNAVKGVSFAVPEVPKKSAQQVPSTTRKLNSRGQEIPTAQELRATLLDVKNDPKYNFTDEEQKQIDTLVDKISYLMDLRYPKDGSSVDAFNASVYDEMIAAATAEKNVLQTKRRDVKVLQTQAARELLFHDEPAPIKAKKHNSFSRATPTAKEQALKGLEIFNKFLGKGGADRLLNATHDPLLLGYTSSGRAYYDPSIAVAKHDGSGPKTMVHEIGHWLEYQSAAVQQAAVDYWFKRTEGESFTQLKKLFPRSGYASHEVCKPDQFQSPYMGKVYGYNAGAEALIARAREQDPEGAEQLLNNLKRGTATEIISMGVENITYDPIAFAERDPDYFDFIWSLVNGYPIAER